MEQENSRSLLKEETRAKVFKKIGVLESDMTGMYSKSGRKIDKLF
jgi:hypothetical protein